MLIYLTVTQISGAYFCYFMEVDYPTLNIQ